MLNIGGSTDKGREVALDLLFERCETPLQERDTYFKAKISVKYAYLVEHILGKAEKTGKNMEETLPCPCRH